MSSADSQLLAASGAFASDVYKPIIRKNKANDSEMMWAGRLIVIVISIVAVLIASNPNSGSIMGLVENAWGLFGAAFGPAVLLSLYWKRFNFGGAVAAIFFGGLVDIVWLVAFKSTGVYEIVPGFIIGLLAGVIVTLITPAPSKDVEELFDKAVAYKD
jgi:sodium/proline symporter